MTPDFTPSPVPSPTAYSPVLPATPPHLEEPDMPPLNVPEAVVQDLWANAHFNQIGLQTTTGKPIEILNIGTLNPDSGADFSDAEIRIDGLRWCGDVEIHTASNQWNLHQHHRDARYNRVILHVTLVEDAHTGTLLREDGSRLPELVLYPRLQMPLRKLLHQFYLQSAQPFPCAGLWQTVPESVQHTLFADLAQARLARKTEDLEQAYLERPDRDSLLYEKCFEALGYRPNRIPMRLLAQRIPLSIARQIQDVKDLEALYLGTASLLPTPAELTETDRITADYVMDLHERYDRLHAQFAIPALSPNNWHHARLRPNNFPALRIAQAIQWLRPNGFLHHDPLAALQTACQTQTPIHTLRDLIGVTASTFWDNHVRLDRPAKTGAPTLGQARTDILLTNAVLPILQLQARQEDAEFLEITYRQILTQLPAPTDHITRLYTERGTKLRHAQDAQGVHQLYRTQCTQARCLTCPAGTHILSAL